MSRDPAPKSQSSSGDGPPGALIAVLAAATGALVANLYYAQPQISSIAPDLHFSPGYAGALVGVTQIGYGAGLFFVVSLADLVENKRLVLITVACVTLGLLALATAQNAGVFMAASFVVGLCSSGAQVLLPFAAQLVPEEKRGRTVGNVMAGVLTGIMLARPIALFIGGAFGWRSVFFISAGLMVVIGVLLWRMMPRHKPEAGLPYPKILTSMFGLVRQHPALRRRAIYQALMFLAFNLFWTAAPLMLAQRFKLSPQAIGLFALAGAGGALAAPIAGRMADRGFVRLATVGAMVILALSFLGTKWAVAGGMMALLVVLTVLLDAAVQVNQVSGQRVIFALSEEARGRINAVYMTSIFIGGALGSTVSTAAFHSGGWDLTAWLGTGIGALMLVLFLAMEGVRRGLKTD